MPARKDGHARDQRQYFKMLRVLFVPFLVVTLTATVHIAVAAERLSAEQLRVEALRHEYGAPGTSRNADRAIALYCDAARQGDTIAQFNLGWIYALGRGTPRDDRTAAYFLKLAADQGHPQAIRLLQQVGQPSGKRPACLFDADGDEIISSASAQQQPFLLIAQRLAPEYGIHPRLAFAVMATESNFNPRAVSIKNAIGLMQLIPETAERFNVRRPFDPEQNIRGGLAYLRWLLAYFEGNVELVVAAYNAGEGVVNRYGGIPPFPETRSYVTKIRKIYPRQQHPFDTSVTAPSPLLQRMLTPGSDI